MQVEGHPGNQDQIQPGRGKSGAVAGGLANAEVSHMHIRVGIVNLAGFVGSVLRHKTGQGDLLPADNASVNSGQTSSSPGNGAKNKTHCAATHGACAASKARAWADAAARSPGPICLSAGANLIAQRLLCFSNGAAAYPGCQAAAASSHASGFGLRGLACANCARHFSTRSLIFFSTPCSVGS